MLYKKTFIFLLVVIVSSLAVLLFFSIFQPSWNSYTTGCGLKTDQELFDQGYIIAGQTEQVDNLTTGKREVTITVVTNDVETIRHEVCHLNQIRNNRLFSCERPILRYFNEVECYVLENFPVFDEEVKGIQEVLNEDNSE